MYPHIFFKKNPPSQCKYIENRNGIAIKRINSHYRPFTIERNRSPYIPSCVRESYRARRRTKSTGQRRRIWRPNTGKLITRSEVELHLFSFPMVDQVSLVAILKLKWCKGIMRQQHTIKMAYNKLSRSERKIRNLPYPLPVMGKATMKHYTAIPKRNTQTTISEISNWNKHPNFAPSEHYKYSSEK